jgi:hypothetical protein
MKELDWSVKALVVASTIVLPGVAISGHDFLFAALSTIVLSSLIVGKKQRAVFFKVVRKVFGSSIV